MHKIFSLLFLFLFAAANVQGQEKGKMSSPKASAISTNAKVTYGQPSKRGRQIFGGLVPYGQVWRTGANEATEITFNKECNFGGKTIKPGTYTLFTIPTENDWTIILNNKLGQWGAFDYEKNKDKDVLQVKVPVKQLTDIVEKFTISISDNMLTMQWDKTSVSVPMKFVNAKN